MASTVEALAVELGRMLDPVRSRLEAGELAQLFGELGLDLPASVQTAPAVVNAVGDATTSLTAVGDKVVTLVEALADEDEAAIVAAVADLLPELVDAFDRARVLADAIEDAYAATGSVTGDLADLLDDLPERLVEFLVVRYLEDHRPLAAQVLALLGVVEVAPVAAAPGALPHVRRQLHLDRIGDVADDPLDLLGELYRWGDPAAALDAESLFEQLVGLLDAVGLPAAVVTADDRPELRTVVFSLAPTGGPPPTALAAELVFSSLSDFELDLPFGGDRWSVRLVVSGELDLGVGVQFSPPAVIEPIAAPGGVSGEIALAADRAPADGEESILVFGERGGTRMTAAALRASVGASFRVEGATSEAAPVVTAAIEGGRIVIALGGADGFLATFLPEELAFDLDLALRFDEDGLDLQGGAGLAVTMPLALALGPAELERLDLAVGIDGDGLTLEARATGGIALGPFAASVEGLGIGAGLAFEDGNLGPVDLSFRFLPPTGLGLSVDAGPVRGGGFILFDEPKGRYAGVLQLGIGDIGVTAIGLLDTKLPGGGDGFALLIVLRGQFPPIQVGFGFALSSVGGILALNRRVDVDALRDRFATGTVGRILAPEDPIRNAPVLLADLAAVFPPTEGIVVVGPTLQLSWIDLVRFDLGIFVELPSFRIVLLGSARAAIDNPAGDRPLLQLRIDIIGLLDIQQKILEFDALLVDSHLLEVFELTGGAAFRLSWGSEPYVVLSVGGFHPAWSPAPLVFPPSLTRIAAVRGAPSDALYLRLEGYFAVTTNTLQFGAAIEAIVNAGPLNARGFVGIDALIRFTPFWFQVDFVASFRVRYKSHTLAGVDVEGTLSGPGPVTFRGKLTIKILFLKFSWSETFTFGSTSEPAVSPVSSAVAELAASLEEPGNLASEGADDRYVLVAPPPAGVLLPVVPPGQQLAWRQDRAPLDLLLERFENAPLVTPETVSASGDHVTGDARDWFAPGSFAELTESEALSRKAFERLTAGVRLGTDGVADGREVELEVVVEQIRLPHDPVPVAGLLLPDWLLRASDARVGGLLADPVGGAIAALDEPWAVFGGDGVALVTDLTQSQAHQLAKHQPAGGAAVAATDKVPAFSF